MAMITIITPYIDGNDQLQLLQRFHLAYVLKKAFECQILIKLVYFNKLKQNPNETNLCYLRIHPICYRLCHPHFSPPRSG